MDDPRTFILMAPGWIKTAPGGENAPLTIAEGIPKVAATPNGVNRSRLPTATGVAVLVVVAALPHRQLIAIEGVHEPMFLGDTPRPGRTVYVFKSLGLADAKRAAFTGERRR